MNEIAVSEYWVCGSFHVGEVWRREAEKGGGGKMRCIFHGNGAEGDIV